MTKNGVHALGLAFTLTLGAIVLGCGDYAPTQPMRIATSTNAPRRSLGDSREGATISAADVARSLREAFIAGSGPGMLTIARSKAP